MFVCETSNCVSQENVMLGAYTPVELSVKTKSQDINCRTYIMNSCVYAPPSPQYLQVRLLLMDGLLVMMEKLFIILKLRESCVFHQKK